MRSQQLDLGKYDTDKVANRYLERYDPIFAPWVSKEVKLLEVGVRTGGSLLLWRDYFPISTIVGIDIKIRQTFDNEKRIQVFEGSQTDTAFLSRVASKTAPDGFDIIIDDASHVGELSKTTFWHLFNNHLKPAGLYVIEDWGTGYWDDWDDGRTVRPQKGYLIRTLNRLASHSEFVRRILMKRSFPCHAHGMVGFIKELVDEQGAADLSRARLSGKPKRQSKFESLLIVPSIVFVKKAICL